jgi:uncharacterized membrane protein YecN with MAPEG domain
MSSKRSRSKSCKLAVVLLTLGCAALANADETRVRLKDAPQAALVRARCSICHSADYIPMNSPFLNKAGWEAEVRKMIKAMGAPIPEEEVAQIVDYLWRNYGVE